MMIHRLTIAFVMMLSLLHAATMFADDREQIDLTVRGFGVLSPVAKPTQPDWQRSGDSWTRPVIDVVSFNERVMTDPNASAVWPGSIVTATSLRTPALTPITLPRKPLTLLVTNAGGNSALNATVDKPDAASVNAALRSLIDKINPASATPQISYSQVEFKTVEQAMAKVGISYAALTSDVKARIDYREYEKRNNLLVDFAQRYFTISIVPPSRPADFFAENVSIADITAVCAKGNPPVYINDVAYGRRLVLLFSSEASVSDLKAAVNASVASATGSGEANIGISTKNILARTELRGIVVGGSGIEAIKVFSGASIADGLRNYLNAGANPTSSSTGAPISFRASYLGDNSVADIQMVSAVDREIRDAKSKGYFLRWSNHFDPGVIYKVVKNMEANGIGGPNNNRYKTYCVRLSSYPGKIISEIEVAGDEVFKEGRYKANSWTSMGLPSLLKRGLEVMDDERWYIVEYEQDIPKPAR